MKLLRPFPLTALLMLLATVIMPVIVFAQATVTGTVTDEANQPLAGVTVTVKGTTTSTSTNEQGRFSIPAAGGATLVFSFVGFAEKELPVNNRATVNTQLQAQDTRLSEVVVTALGIRKDVKKLGYAVQEIKGEDLIKARDANPISGLTGKIAGLSVGPSAEMLRKPTVLLRGNEITLYVVDGIPISSDTWNISPDDIESYTVLKGPTAAALYGSRAQYGAVLITTKKAPNEKVLQLR